MKKKSLISTLSILGITGVIGLTNTQEAWAHSHIEEVTSSGYDTTYEIDSVGRKASEFSQAVTNMRVENGHLHVDVERSFFEGNNRVMFDLNGSYQGEFHNARAFYAVRAHNRDSDQVTIQFARDLSVGDVVRVRLSSGRPGQASNVLEYQTLTVTEKMIVTEFSQAVTNKRIENGHLHVDVERSFFEGNNRVMFDLNGRYDGEFHNGRNYYGVRVHNRQSDQVMIQFARDLAVGDVLRVRLSSGRPGQASNVLEYQTLTVTQEMLTPQPPPTIPEDTIPEFGDLALGTLINEGDLVRHNGHIYRARRTFTLDTFDWAPGVHPTLWQRITTQPDSEILEFNDLGLGALINEGDLVRHNGHIYRALVTFTLDTFDWAPGVATTLWQRV